jgi:putative AlgH/UPF0301 family transcriptional regulator
MAFIGVVILSSLKNCINKGSINNDNIRFFGYTGWHENQLETEKHSWIITQIAMKTRLLEKLQLISERTNMEL